MEGKTEVLECEILNLLFNVDIKIKFCHHTGFYVSAGSNLQLNALDPAKSTPLLLHHLRISNSSIHSSPYYVLVVLLWGKPVKEEIQKANFLGSNFETEYLGTGKDI